MVGTSLSRIILWLTLLHRPLGPPPPLPGCYFSSRVRPAARRRAGHGTGRAGAVRGTWQRVA